MGSKPSGGGSTTTTNKLDPFVRSATEENYNEAKRIAGQSYTPYMGEGVIGFNENQQAAQAGLIGVGQSGLGTEGWQQAAGIAQGAADYNPEQVAAQSGAAGMQDYMNPYTEQVVDNTIGQLDRARQMAVNAGQDQSISAGAYDGSRSALAEGATNEGYARQTASAVGNLYNQGYNTSLQASQADANRALQADGMNQNAGLDANKQRMVAGQLLGQSTQQGYQNAINNQNLIAGVGDAQQGLAQDQANYARQEWEDEQSYEQRMLQLRQGALGNSPLVNAGSSTQSATGGSRSAAAGALGGAASGAALGTSIAPGMGTAVGAGVGGVAGLMGWI